MEGLCVLIVIRKQKHMEETYKEIAKQIRLRTLELVYKAKSSHIGSNFSLIDILTVLYEKVDFDKDEVIISKGWAAASVYATMERKGMIPKEELDTYCHPGSKYIGLLEPGVHPKIKVAGGSMNFGLPFAVGFALSKKMKGEEGKVYCIMSDGELAGGMIWESALIASQHNLNNLIVLVDDNKLQAMGKSSGILRASFPVAGWDRVECLGHDYRDIEREIMTPSVHNLPKVILFSTTKGRGVSFMENDNLWHYKDISDEVYEKAKAELI